MLNRETLDSFCLIRHDVDRKPLNALRMAQLEKELGIVSTYYFRHKPNTFRPDIIKKIADMGHEIGYHYENLSDSDGNIETALADFEDKLIDFRKIAEIKTISMHGRPLKKFDNRDLWREPSRHALLKNKFNILGEVYLDINYEDIAYINDTGRNWSSSKSNLRDKVTSSVAADFATSEELTKYLQNPHKKICFQIHPERWEDNMLPWLTQLAKDMSINSLKKIFNLLR